MLGVGHALAQMSAGSDELQEILRNGQRPIEARHDDRRYSMTRLAPGTAADFICIHLDRASFAGALHDPVAAMVQS